MLWATVSPIFRSTLTVLTAFWDNVPTLLCCRPVTQIGWSSIQSVYSKLKRINKTNFAASCWLLISLL